MDFLDTVVITTALSGYVDMVKDLIVAIIPTAVLAMGVWNSPKIIKRVFKSIAG